MTDKYSFAKCEQYGRRLAARLCDQHFASSPDATLDGSAILGFTPVRQINLFVVRQLLLQWQADINKLRSPYFDFEAPAVQTALLQFQNTLSRYIKLSRSAFEPLLAKATADTLNLAAEPASAIERIFLHQETSASAAQLRDMLRYLDINKEFFSSFIATLPSEDVVPTTVLTPLVRSFQTTNYRAEDAVQRLVSTLSALLPLTEADLRHDGPTSLQPIVSDSSKPLTALPSQGVQASRTVEANDDDRTVDEPISSTPFQSRALSSSDVSVTPLHEKLKATTPLTTPLATTLRAALAPPAPLAERNAPRVETLREAISINQRFSFINELFNGENMEYHAAIQHLDSLTDYEQATNYVTQNLAQRYDWSRKEEHVTKLLKLVERKYASE